MQLAVMQPYFFPYLGYFSLIDATDCFVVFDSVQYIRHGWINRNRILKPSLKEPQYITVPLTKHGRDTTIRDVRIANDRPWKERILGQIQHYKKQSRCFDQVRAILEQCLNLETDRIVDLNVHCLKILCAELGLEFNPIPFLDIESQIESVEDAGEWALHTAVAMKANAYINPAGGRQIFDPGKFAAWDIELGFLETSFSEYGQRNMQFQAGLSILDVLMFNGVEVTRQLIKDYRISFA